VYSVSHPKTSKTSARKGWLRLASHRCSATLDLEMGQPQRIDLAEQTAELASHLSLGEMEI
jgi:hypothetical protein